MTSLHVARPASRRLVTPSSVSSSLTQLAAAPSSCVLADQSHYLADSLGLATGRNVSWLVH